MYNIGSQAYADSLRGLLCPGTVHEEVLWNGQREVKTVEIKKEEKRKRGNRTSGLLSEVKVILAPEAPVLPGSSYSSIENLPSFPLTDPGQGVPTEAWA